MADYLDNYDEIVFLDSEIEEDDDTAPVGVLIHNVNGKAEPVVATSETVQTEEPVQATETVAEEEVQPMVEEPAAASEETVEETAPAVEEPVAEEPVALPESEISPELVLPIFMPDRQPVVEAPAAEEPAPAPEENNVEETPAAEPVAEEESAPEPAPAPKKKASPKKKAATTTIQSAADDGNIWGNAVISKPKKEKAVKEDPAPAPEAQAEKAEEVEKPAKTTKAAPKKKADKEPSKEDKEVLKGKSKDETAKAESKKATKAPAKTEEAKPVTKKAEVEEQIIEAGDDSVNHGKFVIKKTDKGNFVYKLYSFNHRVVAIGAEQYSSLATCKAGVNSVKNNAENAPIEDQTLQKWEEKKCPKWQIYLDKKGEVRLRLIASNGNIVATTNDGYLSKDAAKKGIAAIARASKGASVVRNDDLW